MVITDGRGPPCTCCLFLNGNLVGKHAVRPMGYPMGCYRQLPKDGRYLYLDRYDHDWDYFDHQLRPARTPEAQHSWECGEGKI